MILRLYQSLNGINLYNGAIYFIQQAIYFSVHDLGFISKLILIITVSLDQVLVKACISENKL